MLFSLRMSFLNFPVFCSPPPRAAFLCFYNIPWASANPDAFFFMLGDFFMRQ